MFRVMLNDRELRGLLRALNGFPIEDDVRDALTDKLESIVEENIDSLERIDDLEGDCG